MVDVDDAPVLSDAELEQRAKAMEFVLDLNKNKDLQNAWKTALQKRNAGKPPDTAAKADREAYYNTTIKVLNNIIARAQYDTTAVLVLDLLKTPFYQNHLAESKPNDESKRFVQKILTDLDLFKRYKDVVNAAIEPGGGANDDINKFLKKNGYGCTATQVLATFTQMRNHRMAYWAGAYANTIVTDGNGKASPGPILSVYGNLSAAVGNLDIISPTYKNGTLSWEKGEPFVGNDTSGQITFSQITRPGKDDPYVGYTFSGTITYPDTGTAPLKGKVGYKGRLGKITEADQHNMKVPPDLQLKFEMQVFNFVKMYLLIDGAVTLATAGGKLAYKFLKGRYDKYKADKAEAEDSGAEEDMESLEENAADESSVAEDLGEQFENGSIDQAEFDSQLSEAQEAEEALDAAEESETDLAEEGGEAAEEGWGVELEEGLEAVL